MDQLLTSYGFKTSDNLMNFVSDNCIETAEELASAYRSHYDVAMKLDDAVVLMAACQ